ncbi:GNAT family N-acetyltransferase [Hymenobacter sp. DG25A]|uniref:GNAT family N-acetyltransferase n=1 Tax=Hymenobacter sp. DG25A TaxID=1385663 RepID=UPI0006BC739D|nr:GNAT family N-acetyltransferase [Hymenobacter sp. DG25A]ALD20802.1 GCN5 family acetyltransferase [Hymenobacter sp. DG25A]
MNLPPYDTFPNISGGKTSLRQILSADIADVVEISFYDAIQAKTVEEAAGMQEKINKDYYDGNTIHWGIVENATNKLVGTCGYYRGLNQGEGELGCILLAQFRRHGFMADALQLAIDFGLHNIGLKRIWAITTKQNHKAVKLLERLGFMKVADLSDDEAEYALITNSY